MKTIQIVAVLLLALAGGLPAFGQSDLPPIIEAYRIYIGGEVFDAPLFIDVIENDIVIIEMDVRLVQEEGDDQQDENDDIEFFYEKISRWAPFRTYFTPEGPPVDGDTPELILNPLPIITRLEARFYRLWIIFVVPQFNGVNQARMRGLIDYDLAYYVRVRVWNNESPSDTDPLPRFDFYMFVLENQALRPRTIPVHLRMPEPMKPSPWAARSRWMGAAPSTPLMSVLIRSIHMYLKKIP